MQSSKKRQGGIRILVDISHIISTPIISIQIWKPNTLHIATIKDVGDEDSLRAPKIKIYSKSNSYVIIPTNKVYPITNLSISHGSYLISPRSRLCRPRLIPDVAIFVAIVSFSSSPFPQLPAGLPLPLTVYPYLPIISPPHSLIS